MKHLTPILKSIFVSAISFCFTLSAFAQAPVANFTANQVKGCAVHIVTFTNQSTNTPTTLTWNFGNGNPILTGNPATNPTLNNPTVSYINPGTYTVTLTATNASGTDTKTRTAYITVFANPTPEFTAVDTTGCAPFTTTFNNLSTPGSAPINQWVWDLGNGQSSNLQNPGPITYAPGTYQVSLTTIDTNGCIKIKTRPLYIVVTPNPTASFSVSLLNCSSPFNVSFTNNSTPAAGLTYAWNFGNGNTSTVQSPTNQTYTGSQLFTVTLTVTNASGCSHSTTRTVSAFNAAFTPVSSSGCVPFSTQFTDQSNPPATSWFWNFGDPASGASNSSSFQNPFHMFSAPGTYNVRLIAVNSANCPDTVFRTVTVHPPPVGGFRVNNQDPCMIPTVLTFTDTTAGATAWQWNMNYQPGQPFSTNGTTNPFQYTYNSEGDYNVALIVTNQNGCKDTIIRMNYIHLHRPVANFSADKHDGCIPLPVVFTDASTSANPITGWAWNFGDGSTSTLQNPAHTYTTEGVFPVTLTITNSLGCTRTFNDTIKTGIPPVANFVVDTMQGCRPDKFKFTDLSSPYTDEWTWDFGSSEQNPEWVFPDTGYFPVQLIASYHGCKDTLKIDSLIYIFYPLARFAPNPSLLCRFDTPYTVSFTNTSHTTGPNIWFWDFGVSNLTNDTSNLENPLPYTYTSPGAYTVWLKVRSDVSNCKDSLKMDVSISNFSANFIIGNNTGCAPHTTTFLQTSFDNALMGSADNWVWDFGDGTIVVQNQDSAMPHTFNTPGVYNVKLIAQHSSGCTDTIVKVVIVRPLPVANFSASPPLGCTPLTVNFTDNSTSSGSTITQWRWDFDGDGIPDSFVQNPTFTYTTGGQVGATLRVTDANGCVSAPYLVYINVNAIAANLSAPPTGCNGSNILFNGNSSVGTGLTYAFNFGDGSPVVSGTSAIAYHTYNVTATSTFTATLTITDVNGCSVSATKDIIIYKTTANFSQDASVSECPPFFIQFYNQGTADITSWNYIWGDGGSNTVNTAAQAAVVSHVYNSPGLYTVTLIVTNQIGCRDTLIKPNLVSVGGPAATMSFNPKNGCAPLTVTFTASNTMNVANYLWVFGDGSIGSGNPVTHTYTLAGTFIPVLQIEDSLNTALGDTVQCRVVIVNDSIVIRGPLLEFSADIDSICTATTITFTNETTVPSGINIATWQWSFGDGTTSNQQNPPPHLYSAAGNFTVKLVVTTADGCTYTLEKADFITMLAPPALPITINTVEGCKPLYTLFTADTLNLPYTITSFEWNFGDGGTSDSLNASHIYHNAGTYLPKFVVVFDNACSYEYSFADTVKVHPTPVAGFEAYPYIEINIIRSMDFENTSTGGVSYLWNFGDGDTSSLFSLRHTYAAQGEYQVMLVVTNEFGCKDTVIRPYEIDFEIMVPNVFTPNGDGINDMFNLKIPGSIRCLKLQVFDRWGHEVYVNDDYQNNWNGTNKKDKALPPDVYYYILNICNRLSYTGFVHILYDNK